MGEELVIYIYRDVCMGEELVIYIYRDVCMAEENRFSSLKSRRSVDDAGPNRVRWSA